MMKIVFLDRDGVINRYPGDGKYVTSWKEFVLLPGVSSAIRRLNKAGFKVCIISNQAGVSKGIFSAQTLEEITRNMLALLREKGATVDFVSYCIHTNEQNCSCKKPKTGLVDEALRRLAGEDRVNLDLSGCFLVGDSLIDIKTGKSAGLKTIIVFSGKEKPKDKASWDILPDYFASDLSEAVDIILK